MLRVVLCMVLCFALGSSPAMGLGTDLVQTSLSQDQAAIDAAASREFRNIFYSYAQDNYSADLVKRLVFLPTPSMLATKLEDRDPKNTLDQMSLAYQSFKPSDLYEEGLKIPMAAIPAIDTIFHTKGPITIVIIPGIFGEFITTYPYADMIENSQSSLSQHFQQALTQAEDQSLVVDASFDFEAMKNRDLPLSTLIKMASIDDENGQPLVNVIVLKSPSFSAETLGSLQDNREIYLRRISKVLQLIGMQERLYILGYSRGAAVALDLVTEAAKRSNEFPWFSHIKGMISLGGVLYGTAFADAALNPADPLGALIDRVSHLADSLEWLPPTAPLSARMTAALYNARVWNEQGIPLLIQLQAQPQSEGLALEDLPSDLPDPQASIRGVLNLAFHKFNFSNPLSLYSLDNVAKFKFLVKNVVIGVSTLTTDARVTWWREHIVPQNLQYFAISGTMGNASTAEDGVWELTGNSDAFNKYALDYRLLRSNYYDLYRLSGNQVQDGQVTMERSRFRYDVNRRLNPDQPEFESYYMGVLGTDHWGFSFPYSAISLNHEISPYPRTIVIQSIANFVARHSPCCSKAKE